MGVIRQLSDVTVNRIAAGEVVERPASVIKELVENAIDAGATKIHISFEKSGKNLIIVSDNGVGLSAEDLSLSVERHTTSKLNDEDIMNISTFGFRGEALPSIASVSKMKITSKSALATEAYEIDIECGEKSEVHPAVHQEGTRVEVRDLFFKTPARLKFLRSDKTEYNACLDIIKKLAIAYSQVYFTVVHEGKLIYQLRVDETATLYQLRLHRIAAIFSDKLISNAVEISLSREEIEIQGIVSLPTYNKASSEDQLIFVNFRPVKDKLLLGAVRSAYQGLLARDRYPVLIIFININPYNVDVNVHPAKNEVRFHEPQIMRGILVSAIKDALLTVSNLVSNSLPDQLLAAATLDENLKISNFSSKLSSFSDLPITNSWNNFIPAAKHNGLKPVSEIRRTAPFLVSTKKSSDFQLDLHQKDSANLATLDLGRACAQLHRNYIISQTSDGIILTDQHAAHERITYQKLRSQFYSSNIIRQKLLIPEIVTLLNRKQIDILHEKRDDILKLGMLIDELDDTRIRVSEVPALLEDFNIAKAVQDIADYFLEHDHLLLEDMVEEILLTYSCYHSVRSGRVLSIEEMNYLLREIEVTEFSGQCNHGRPTYVKLKLQDIEKLFGRR